MTGRWTAPGDIAATVRRRWDDGTLLRSYSAGGPFDVIGIPVHGPKPSEIGDDLAAVRDWVAVLDGGRRDDRRYTLTWRTVGGRRIGRNELPDRAIVSTFDQAWALLGVRDAVRQFDEILAIVGGCSAVRAWAVGHPHRALELHGDLPGLLAAFRWLDAHRDSGHYLREISAPGVDTKFAEKHRAVLAAMLGVPSTASGFVSGLGLASKPELVRVRPAPTIGIPLPATEVAMRAAELAALDIRPRTAIIVENEISYLSVDVPQDGIVLWGRGFDVDRVGRLPWLVEVDVVYWGDLDTHGFAILDRLRAWLPQTRSVMMDRETLMAHRDRWVVEKRPATSSLTRLTRAEQDLFVDLVTDALGAQVRLEQERVDWSWAEQRLAAAHGRAT
ncbi:MAG: Wadjet anti-phage system protein JetD domain-containing protein [Dermatophilaceae bacterium]